MFINVAYDVRKASWYESMGILPLAWVPGHPDPAAKDPFDDAAAVQNMYDEGGVLTHRRLPENIDKKARKDLGLPNPRKLKSKGTVPASGIDIRSFSYLQGGFTAVRGFPHGLMRPPVINSGQSVTFTNLDALHGRAEHRSGLAQHHLLPAALQQGLGDRLPARQRPDQVRLRPARLRNRAELRGDDRLQRLHDAAAHLPGRTGRARRQPRSPTSAGSTR